MSRTSVKDFAITFHEAKCGLEILFDPRTNEFTVGDTYHSDTAKKFSPVLPGSLIVSMNGTPTKGMTSMDDIQTMFQTVGAKKKVVVFRAKLNDKQISEMNKFAEESNQFQLVDVDMVEMSDGHYIVTIKRRPLGFTIAASPDGEVQVVQVDSVNEEDLKLGSKLISVNGEHVTGEKDAMEKLLKCTVPVTLFLEMASENLFAPPEMKDDVDFNELALSGNSGDMVELSVHWFESNGRDDFILLIKADASVAEMRAKIAVLSQLKFDAVKIIAKGALLKDDNLKLSDLYFQDTDKVTVVVSHKTQMKEEEKVPVDYEVQMKIVGAYLKSCDKSVLDYLWEDIDYEHRNVLHATELDRLISRFMGIYERATCVYTPMEFRHGTVTFNSTENLGLVIEGNEVIMCNAKSQAQRQGMAAGWKVVGAEYGRKVTNEMVKFPVDHHSCLHSLKRAKLECNDQGFRVICQIPTGIKFETMAIMRKQAIAVLRLDDPEVRSTLTRKNYEDLPNIFAQNAMRISLESLDASAFCKNNASEKGAVISSECEFGKVYAGSFVLSINGQTVVHMPFGDVMKLVLEKRKYHTITIDMTKK